MDPRTWTIVAAALAVLAYGVFRRRTTRSGRQTGDSLDERTLSALARAGSDLTKETEVLFFLYFPTEAHARSAATVAAREQFVADVRQPGDAERSWTCVLTRQMVPSANAIERERLRLEDLAKSLGGEFDGWEAEMTT